MVLSRVCYRLMFWNLDVGRFFLYMRLIHVIRHARMSVFSLPCELLVRIFKQIDEVQDNILLHDLGMEGRKKIQDVVSA